MGPMGLFALGEATHSDFGPWIYKGLEWIGKNELGVDLEDSAASLVWRCVQQGGAVKYWSLAKAFLTKHRDTSSKNGLAVRFECRPYELGWLLYAFANAEMSPTRSAPANSKTDSPRNLSGACR